MTILHGNEPTARPGRYLSMEKAKQSELRMLLTIAKQLRDGASQTKDQAYSDLFLRTAHVLEERASALAFPSHGSTPRTGHWPRVHMDTLN